MKQSIFLTSLLFLTVPAFSQGIDKTDDIYEPEYLQVKKEIINITAPLPGSLAPLDSIILARWEIILDTFSELEALKSNGIISKSELVSMKSDLYREIQRLIAMRASAIRRRWD